jgi:hypothetical protein
MYFKIYFIFDRLPNFVLKHLTMKKRKLNLSVTVYSSLVCNIQITMQASHLVGGVVKMHNQCIRRNPRLITHWYSLLIIWLNTNCIWISFDGSLYCPFQQYFSYIVAVSFIGGGNWRSWRKPQTCRKPLTNFITKCCIEYTSTWAGFVLTTLVVIGIDCTGSCKSNYSTIMTKMSPPLSFMCMEDDIFHKDE